MSEVIRRCDMCGAHHPADVTCQSAKELAEKIRESHSSEAMDYSGRNPMVALAIAEGWHGSEKFNAPDLLAALHQTTGIPFMREYVKQAMSEGVISPKTPKPFDALGTRELMRLFKTAYDRYGLTSTKEDAPVPVNAGPRSSAPIVDLSQLTDEERAQFKARVQQARSQPGNVVYMGKGEGEEFMIGDTTYKPEDEPQSAAPQDGSKVRGYRKLSVFEIEKMNTFKAATRNLVDEIDTYAQQIRDDINGPAMMSTAQRAELDQALRWLAIARTDAQRACMAACRAAAKPEDDC